MMNTDMGLYLKFDATEGDANGFGNGRPSGCPGLEREDWLKNDKWRKGLVYEKEPRLEHYTDEGYLDYTSRKMNGRYISHSRHSTVIPGNRYSGCNLNDDVAENGQKWHEIVEDYASDNDAFIQDFTDVFQKMMENGYQAGNSMGNEVLKASNWTWVNMRCNKNRCDLKF